MGTGVRTGEGERISDALAVVLRQSALTLVSCDNREPLPPVVRDDSAQQRRPEDIVASLTRLDVVICEQILEHVEDPRTAVANLRRLTRPGGRVMVSTPFLIRVHELEQYEIHDYGRFIPRGLARLLEDTGLVVDEVGDWGNRWCVLDNLGHGSSDRRWHTPRRELGIPVQVSAVARNLD